MVDKKGILCPLANNTISFKVEGKGTFRASGNGDPTDLELFHAQKRKCFYGKCVAIVQTSEEAGEIKLIATSDNFKSAAFKIRSR